jgi:hypothetical protein
MPKDDAPPIWLALQGGAHAALTWSVLERLLDEVEHGRLVITSISATSGGVQNGAAMRVSAKQKCRRSEVSAGAVAQPCYKRLPRRYHQISHGSNEYPNAHGPI